MICKKCGAVLEDNNKFCANCGTPVEQPIQPNEPTPVIENIEQNINETITTQQINQTSNAQINQPGENTPLENNMVEPPKIPNDDKKNKKNILLPIIILLVIIAAVCGGLYYYLNNTKRIITKVINGAYDKFEELAYTQNDYDYEKESIIINGDLTLDTNIENLQNLSVEKISYSFGLDYQNKKLEAGIALSEENITLIDAIIYILNDTGYISFKEDYPNIIKLDESEIDFSEIFNISESKISEEDIKFIIKTYKDILIESLDMKDFEKSTTTIKIDNKDTKVNKISYELNEERYQKIIKNMIEKTTENTKLLETISTISEIDVAELKEGLNELKNEVEDIDLGTSSEDKFVINIYTKAITNTFVGIDFDGRDGQKIEIRKNTDNTSIDIKDEYETVSVVIKELGTKSYSIDFSIKDETEVTGNITTSYKEISKNNYEGSVKLTVKNEEKFFTLSSNYTTKIGEQIASINTAEVKNSSEITEEELTELLEKIEIRFENSKIYSVFENLVDLIDDQFNDNYYDPDFGYDYGYGYDYNYNYGYEDYYNYDDLESSL